MQIFSAGRTGQTGWTGRTNQLKVVQEVLADLKIAQTCVQHLRVSPTMLGGWLTKDQICVFPSGRYLLNMIDKGNLTRTTLLRGYTPSDQIYQNHNPNVSASQGGFNCSSLPAGLGGNGEIERKFEEISEETIQNEVSLGGSPPITGTLLPIKSNSINYKQFFLFFVQSLRL